MKSNLQFFDCLNWDSFYFIFVQVPPGTSSHSTIRLNGQGLKKVNSTGHGDHYVHLKIVVPKRLDDKQKALLIAYAEVESETPGTVHGINYKKDGMLFQDTKGN